MKTILLVFVIHFYVLIDAIEVINSGYDNSRLMPTDSYPSNANLSCYTCSTIEAPECRLINETYYYYNGKYATFNTRTHGRSCTANERYCAVLRLDTKIDQNAVDYQFWAIERKCLKSCVDGCFVMGERTKLSLCTTCCSSNFCNIGDTSHPLIRCNSSLLVILVILSFVCNYKMFSK